MDKFLRFSFQKERHKMMGLIKRNVFFTIEAEIFSGLETRPLLWIKYPKNNEPNIIEKLYTINIICLFIITFFPIIENYKNNRIINEDNGNRRGFYPKISERKITEFVNDKSQKLYYSRSSGSENQR